MARIRAKSTAYEEAHYLVELVGTYGLDNIHSRKLFMNPSCNHTRLERLAKIYRGIQGAGVFEKYDRRKNRAVGSCGRMPRHSQSTRRQSRTTK